MAPGQSAPTDTAIPARLAAVRQALAEAALAAGRDPASVRLVAVSKTHPASAVAAALGAGQVDFGENRVAEAAGKFTTLRRSWPALHLHLIGPLQTNKAREAVSLADTIHSLDRPRLAVVLAAEMARAGRRPDCLVQVNTGREPQKAGIPPEDADEFIEFCRAQGLPVTGLMCIPPAGADPRPHFSLLRTIAARHGLAELSMGMSADYRVAVAEGATMVRIGTAIFGDRPRV